MKTNINIFNELNESFEKEIEAKRKLPTHERLTEAINRKNKTHKKLTEGTAYKRIARYNEFDNGYVIHNDWKKISDEEAEELAKQASIEDPTDVYYVQFDDIMNSSNDNRWYKGELYTVDEIRDKLRKEKEALWKKAQQEKDSETKSDIKEADLNTYKDKDEAAYYRNKELYSNSGLERHKKAMEKAKKACEDKGIKLYKDHNEKYEIENKIEEDIIHLTPTKLPGEPIYFIKYNEDITDVQDLVGKYVNIKGNYHAILKVEPTEDGKYIIDFAASTDANNPGGEFEPATLEEINNLQLYIEEKKECDNTIKEDETVIIPDTEIEPDYIINDVTVLDSVGDGDVQAPDIDALLTLVNESLVKDYGNDWGHINVLSSRIDENSSFALVDITTKEILREFEEKGIKDVAVGKSLILENAKSGLVEFKVNSLNGVTRFSKKTNDPAKIIKEWIETEYLHESMLEKEAELLQERTKAEKDAVENYVKSRPDLMQAIENINMFIEVSKAIKAKDEMKPAIQDRMYGLAVEFPANIQVTNKDDKYELTFDGRDQIVEIVFGKEWVKEPTEDNKVPEMVTPKQGLKESYQQFNIGEIEVVFNPDTYECLYSIPSADVKDKKVNLSDVPTVDTPYDTNTIIKSYVETKFGRIPTEEPEEDKVEVNKEVTATAPDGDSVSVDTTTEVPAEEDIPVEEAELPDEPGEEPTDDVDVNVDLDTPAEETQEDQAETGSATFVKVRPKQHTSVEDIRTNIVDGDTPQSNYIVVDETNLSEEDWNNLISDLSTPQAFLEGIKSIDRKNYSFNVVKVTSPAANYTLLIDPLGYSYPRYIAVVD